MMKPLLLFLYYEWIGIADGRAKAWKGRYPQRTISEISDIFAEYPDLKGHIRCVSDRRYRFSRSIPEPLRQRVRNVLACR